MLRHTTVRAELAADGITIVKAEPTPLPASAELRAARYELISRLADDLAHEIKNPLHAMVINLEVLRRRVTSGDAVAAAERADVIEHELHRVNHLIERILLLLRPERNSGAATALDAALTEIVPLIAIRAKAARKTFHFEAAADGCVVQAPPDAIKLAVLALTEWATDAVPRDGAGIALRSSCEPGRAIICLRAHGALAPASGRSDSLLDDPLGLARALLADADGVVGATPADDRGYCEVSLTLACSGGA